MIKIFSSQKIEMSKFPNLFVFISCSTSSLPYYYRRSIELSSLFELLNCDELFYYSFTRMFEWLLFPRTLLMRVSLLLIFLRCFRRFYELINYYRVWLYSLRVNPALKFIFIPIVLNIPLLAPPMLRLKLALDRLESSTCGSEDSGPSSLLLISWP